MMDLSIKNIEVNCALMVFNGEIAPDDEYSVLNPIREQVLAGAYNVILDMSDVSYINSAGIGALAGGLKSARQAGGDMIIVNPSAPVRSLLAITQLDSLFAIHGDLEEALDSLKID